VGNLTNGDKSFAEGKGLDFDVAEGFYWSRFVENEKVVV